MIARRAAVVKGKVAFSDAIRDTNPTGGGHWVMAIAIRGSGRPADDRLINHGTVHFNGVGAVRIAHLAPGRPIPTDEPRPKDLEMTAPPKEVLGPAAGATDPVAARTWRGGTALVATLIALGALTLLTATLSDYGMSWDEGFTVEREERLREWFRRVAGASPSRSRAWSPSLSMLETREEYLRTAGARAWSPWNRDSLRFYWQFARAEPNGHPPFYALLGLAAWEASRHILPPPSSYRFGPALLFAATLGAMYAFMARRFGKGAGVVSALGLLAMPRVFAHAHLASYDAPTLSLWFLAVASFLQATDAGTERGRRAWTLAFGVFLGCAAATKFTGWFLPFPIAAWILLYRDRRAAGVLLLGGVVAALVVYALIPTWWANPVAGVSEFLRSNLTRRELRPIPTLFLGRLYLFSLPWYNTLVLTAVVVPPVLLGLAITGMAAVVRGRLRDRDATMLLICWAFLMVLRALPNAPGHDGERLFLPAFAFLACLAGIGLTSLRDRVSRWAGPGKGRAFALALLGIALASGAWSTWRYHPLQLSYYNVMIGGLSGATRAGMEPTYYWEAVTPDVCAWLNEHTKEGETIAFVFPAITFEYLRRWGLLRPEPVARLDNRVRWFIVMNRPGHLLHPPLNLGRSLLESARPVFVKSLEVAPEVPLIAIYRGSDARTAEATLKEAEARAVDPDSRPN